jgi:hypothetical protein
MKKMKKLNLTNSDRPLSKGDTNALSKWWSEKGWDVEKKFSHKRRGKKFFHLTATKENNMELNFKNWLLTEAVVKHMGAYWISPGGGIIPVEGGIHIQNIVNDPKLFGFTPAEVQDTFKKYGESPSQEGTAREELMVNAMMRGWIRLRKYNRPDFWSVQTGALTSSFYKRLTDWAWDMLMADAAHKYDDIRISAVSTTSIRSNDQKTFQDLTTGADDMAA